MLARTIILAVVLLGGCAPSNEFNFDFPLEPSSGFEEGWPYTRAPTYPYGTWASSDGFRIELRRDGTYLVCGGDPETCDQGILERGSGLMITLRGFNVPEHPVAQQLVSLTSTSSHWTRGADLDFTPNMGPPANAEHCGGRPCVMLGAHLPGSEYIFILQGDS